MMIYLLTTMTVLSLLLTWGLRRYALAKNLMDIPNHRSSHALPTPRGGGLAFIVVFFVSIPFLALLDFEVYPVGIALFCSGTLVALLGFLDDKGHVAARVRLLCHFMASLFALYCLGGMPAIPFLGGVLSAGLGLNVLAVLYLVWLLNLYNFMDGIDGLSGLEAFTVCIGISIIYWLNGESALLGLPLALAFAVAGFLWWNFPPARIFMGDAGSGFLGLILGLFSIQAAIVKPELFWCWLILLGVFIVDATVTLLYRLCRGCKVYEAHRSHAYQNLAKHLGKHLWVTLGVSLINLCWLFPMALLVSNDFISGFNGLIVAYLPLIGLALVLKAGRAS